MATMTRAAAAAVLALTLATGARADDAPQQVTVVGKMGPVVDCAPNYPNAAARMGAQGATVLAFHVDATGKATGVEIVRSAGATREHRMLDNAAATALARCPFVAALDEQGQPVASVITVTYTWVLE